MGIVSKLEGDLIPPNRWKELYEQMPKECQEIVNEPPEALGIGKNKKYGWFIMGSGQGPVLLWSEQCKS